MKKSSRKDPDLEAEEIVVEEELSEKDLKKKKQKEGAEKRKNAKKKDKVARWGGLILLGLVMFVGFLLWVSGEMKNTTPSSTIPSTGYTQVVNPGEVKRDSSIIVK